MQHALKCWNFVDCGIFPCFIFPFRDKNLKWWGNISELRRHYNYDFAASWPIRVLYYGRDADQSAARILGGKRGKMVLGKLSGARLSCGDAVESFSRRMDIGGKVALWKSVYGCNYLWFVPQGGDDPAKIQANVSPSILSLSQNFVADGAWWLFPLSNTNSASVNCGGELWRHHARPCPDSSV